MDLGTSTALVTGASGGLGEQFARLIAARGRDVVLVARSEDRLRAIAEDLRAAHPDRRVEVVPLDLGAPESPQRLAETVGGRGLTIDLLVNNAGAAVHGDFLDVPLDRSLLQIDLDVRALVAVTRLFLPPMVERRRGAVLNVASTAAFQPLPGTAVYAAAKTFVRSFTEALRYELRDTGVTAVAVAPGPMQTGFFRAAGAEYLTKGRVTPQSVAEFSLDRLDGRAAVVIPGFSNKLVVLGERFAPRRLLVQGAARATRVSD